jgi:hypothetical protein
MKKKITIQELGNNETDGRTQIGSPLPQYLVNKRYRDHKSFDRSHGRVNQLSIGINHEPGTF